MTQLLDADVDWAEDNKTLVFEKLQVPEVIAAAYRTQDIRGPLTPEIAFDLSQLDRAFSPRVLALAAITRGLRERGVEVALILPTDEKLHRHFLNTNWAHLMAPSSFGESASGFSDHMPATEYGTTNAQSEVVSTVTELLLLQANIAKDVLGAFEWSMNEVTDNVLTHAEDPLGGFVQVTKFLGRGRGPRRYEIVVADAGRGIGSSMRESFPELVDDIAACKHALEPGITSGPGQGNGLAGIQSIAELAGGEISILSGHAYGQLNYSDETPVVFWRNVFEGVNFPGTVVTVSLPLDVELDLREALRFQSPDWEPFDLVEAKYEAEQEGTFVIRLADEPSGRGTRESGRLLRNKVQNLISRDEHAIVRIDFSEVTMVSSSFADEFLGKLRLAMGPTAFDLHILFVNLPPPVQAVIAGAVSQRMRSGE